MRDHRILFEKSDLIGENTIAFTFDGSGSNYTFNAGQYAHFTLTDPKHPDVKGNTRAFSFANAPNKNCSIMIAARINSSVFVNNLRSLEPGAELFISKPSGGLRIEKDTNQPLVFIAGGTGITPVRSITEDLYNKNDKRLIKIFHLNRKISHAAFKRDFIEWSRKMKTLKYITVVDEKEDKDAEAEHGRINSELLKKYIDDFTAHVFYLTGPSQMVHSVKELLKKNNVSENKIQTENFS